MANVLTATQSNIQIVADYLKSGGVAIVPTSTNYNIICDPFNTDAVKKLFAAKHRTKFGPLTLYLPSTQAISSYTLPTPGFSRKIADGLWPGEVSFILYKQGIISDAVTCGANTIAVTYHADPTLQGIIEAFGHPVSGSSANRSGQGDIFVTVEKAIADLGEHVDVILNAGATSAAFHPSTDKSNSIVDFSFQPPLLVRKGVVSTEILQKFIPNLIADPDLYQIKLQERLSSTSH